MWTDVYTLYLLRCEYVLGCCDVRHYDAALGDMDRLETADLQRAARILADIDHNVVCECSASEVIAALTSHCYLCMRSACGRLTHTKQQNNYVYIIITSR